MAVKNFVSFCFLTTFLCSIFEVTCILPPSYEIQSSEAPFAVSILINRRHYCGGVILSEHIVLTAGHCIAEHFNMSVSAGQSGINVADNKQTVGVKKTLRHENFMYQYKIQAYYDIGLLLLQTPFMYNQYVQPIDWTNNIDFDKPVSVYGWGSTDPFHKSPSQYLRVKNVSLIRDTLCVEMLNKAIIKCEKQLYELCAEKSSCHGDSGGPMVQKVDNVTKLIGITSWGADDNISCDTSPAVFVNVGYFSKWILEGMRVLMIENRNDTENMVHVH